MKSSYTIKTLLGILLAGAILFDFQDSSWAVTRSFETPILLVSLGPDGKPAAGSVGKMEFSLRRSEDEEDGPLRIAISEDYAMGTEDDAVASVWMAATVASFVTGKNLTGHELTAKFTGASGGPSAGGVYCLSIIAALNHKDFPDDLVMTGTIMPDGSIGPVGGVPYKLYAAKKAGYRRAIIPLFSSMEEFVDPDTGTSKTVDPAEFGKSLGLEVTCVESIEDAYAAAFDSPLRKPRTSTHPARYSDAIASAVRSDRDALLQCLPQSPEDQKKFDDFVSQFPKDQMTWLEDALARAESAKAASLISASHYRVASAVPFVLAFQKTLQEAQEIPSDDPDVLRASIDKAVDQINQQAQSLACASNQQSGTSWRDVQLMPDIDYICEMATAASALRDSAHKATEKKDLAEIWGVTHFFANLSDSLSGQQSPFTHTHAALDGLVHNRPPLDPASLNVLLSELISAGRVNAKAAERVGQQRAQDDQAADMKAGMAGANRLREHGTDYEMRLGFVERLSQLDPNNSTALVQACLMACQILADTRLGSSAI